MSSRVLGSLFRGSCLGCLKGSLKGSIGSRVLGFELRVLGLRA